MSVHAKFPSIDAYYEWKLHPMMPASVATYAPRSDSACTNLRPNHQLRVLYNVQKVFLDHHGIDSRF